MTSKTELRKRCRDRWGVGWHKVHPIIKKTRLMWADSAFKNQGTVNVHENGEHYTV